MIGKPTAGKKPKVGNYASDGNGKMAPGSTDGHPPLRLSLHSARGGQNQPRPVVKAKEKSTKPVTGGGTRSTTGKTKSKNKAKDPTIP